MAEPDNPEAPAPAEADAAVAPGAADAAATAAAIAAATAAAEAAAPDLRVAQLRGAGEHFMAGNFAAARRDVRELLRGEVPPEIRKQADELMRRMGLDPVALWIAVGSTVLFVVVVVLTFRR